MSFYNSEYIEPNALGYTIYTKSNCIYCTKAKEFFDNKKDIDLIINCDGYISKNKEAFLAFIKNKAGREYRTFPMIFHDGKFVGGFTELKPYYDKMNAFLCFENENLHVL